MGEVDRKETLMERIVIKLTRQVKRHLRRTTHKIKDAKLKTRYLIVLHTAEGYSRRQIIQMLLCSASTVDRVRRRSALFIELLKKPDRHYADRKVIRIIPDNYIIHLSKITQRAAAKFNGRTVLYFLAPYCPDDSKIERCVWR